MKIEIYQDKQLEYRWRAVSRNGQIVADSAEGYFSKSNARRAWNSFIKKVYQAKFIVEDND